MVGKAAASGWKRVVDREESLESAMSPPWDLVLLRSREKKKANVSFE